MKYKVGDEVLVRARIIRSYEDGKYIIEINEDGYYKTFDHKGNDIFPYLLMTAEEAWKILSKILLYQSNGGFNSTELEEIFGRTEHLWELSPQQAKDKIKAWEAKKEINVGDEVEFDGEIGVVTKTDGAEGFYNVLFKNWETGAYQPKRLKKTGRNIDIDGLLQQIGGNE